MKKVCFVCLGNICRSPMAEFVMKEVAKDSPLLVESRATSNWEHGNPIHRGTQAIFKKHGIAYEVTKASQQISVSDLETFDYIIGMDEDNVHDLKRLSAGRFDDKIFLFVEGGVPDPWYTGDFDETYDLVTKGCQDWLHQIMLAERDLFS
ncbi:low molecular weight protein-tyrosine-phosphatase [Streptococcus saliviloxodontae]|uniref:protein-tyrosine-phosphatase n=1 Tax=Streptococcus saliviloxodontae TaxID=1349416 RepID=A0ABS2PKX0_9STRE|nr:low molecular weight protein-tyrosine-phosphatase [Streptococcus saliviloxodontae]MBM7635731.1 protein-tyrosine phosphatase [Streptococcus saliviloxodontae]